MPACLSSDTPASRPLHAWKSPNTSVSRRFIGCFARTPSQRRMQTEKLARRMQPEKLTRRLRPVWYAILLIATDSTNEYCDSGTAFLITKRFPSHICLVWFADCLLESQEFHNNQTTFNDKINTLSARVEKGFSDTEIGFTQQEGKIMFMQWQVGLILSALIAFLTVSYPWIQIFAVTDPL